MLFGFIIFILLLIIGGYFYLQHPMFGQKPTGERLAQIQQSSHYQKGKFRNLIEKPDLTEGANIVAEVYKTFFKTIPDREPTHPLPSIKTDLKALDPQKDVLVWFGHSSVYMQLHGKKFLIDPVMSGKASPFPWGTRAYKGTDIYSVDDLPDIDYLLISHDHYDHLDYETILKLKNKVKFVVTGLGVGQHFEYWGYSKDKLIEKDWGDKVELGDGISIITETSHHGSGRAIGNAKNLWVSFIIQTPERKIFYTGDGGYDQHFAALGQKYGPFDWALMENGQYDPAWHSVHSHPDEVARAAEELGVRNMIPVHHSKFSLAKHAWYEPITRISEYSKNRSYRLVTPMIGELVELDNEQQIFQQWWKNVGK